MHPTRHVLSVKNLTVNLKEGNFVKRVIHDVSFTLNPGESLGIVGESGSGKTITALSLLKLLPPGMRISDGKIVLNLAEGLTDLALLSEKQIRSYRGSAISMIFQEPMTSLNPSMRCGDQIAESARFHGNVKPSEVKKKVFSLLDEVHLLNDQTFYNKYPHQLSGGQRQRIMIAMALAGNPGILIADEPTTALDVTVQKKILELIKEIQAKREMSMLFISHDLGVIRAVCENALVMYRGEIVEAGKVSDLFSNPGHAYTRGLIACRPGLAGNRSERLPTLSDFLTDEGSVQDQMPEQIDKSRGNNQQYDNPVSQPADSEEVVPLLQVASLSVDYILKKNFLGRVVNSLRAVNRIDFSLVAGETLGLIGESGSGKSTLGRSLIRLIQSRDGSIFYRGENIALMKGRELNQFRQKVQFIFQDPFSSLNPKLAVGMAIMEVMKVHGIHQSKKERRQATLALLGKVGLAEEHFERYPHEFSGGQRQRIGLARAMATGPELIICDESVSSLDVSVQAMILNLLNELKKDFNLTYLFISHDLSVVRYMSDRILVMKEGKLVEEGPVEQIFQNPSSEYTHQLLDSIMD